MLCTHTLLTSVKRLHLHFGGFLVLEEIGAGVPCTGEISEEEDCLLSTEWHGEEPDQEMPRDAIQACPGV